MRRGLTFPNLPKPITLSSLHPFTTVPTLLQSRIHLAMPPRFGFSTDNRRGSAAAIKMPDSQDDCTTKGSDLYPSVTPTCEPDAPINADWQRTVYPLQAHALEEPVEQSANAVGSTGR